MSLTTWRDRAARIFEAVIASALLILLAAAVLIATVMLYTLAFRNAGVRIHEVTDASMLQSVMQLVFGGVLAVLLGLELMETIRRYDADHHVRVEVVFFVGLIAVGRHVIQLDLEHASLGQLAGTAALILGLSGGYLMVRRAARE